MHVNHVLLVRIAMRRQRVLANNVMQEREIVRRGRQAVIHLVIRVNIPSKALRRVPNVRWGSKLVLQMDTRVVTAEGTVVLVTTEIQQ